jgi:hypothetical protein
MQEWVRVRGDFQKRILARQRGFGMTAVLSAFAGHVPKALIDKHPDAKFTRSADWAGVLRVLRVLLTLSILPFART